MPRLSQRLAAGHTSAWRSASPISGRGCGAHLAFGRANTARSPPNRKACTRPSNRALPALPDRNVRARDPSVRHVVISETRRKGQHVLFHERPPHRRRTRDPKENPDESMKRTEQASSHRVEDQDPISFRAICLVHDSISSPCRQPQYLVEIRVSMIAADDAASRRRTLHRTLPYPWRATRSRRPLAAGAPSAREAPHERRSPAPITRVSIRWAFTGL